MATVNRPGTRRDRFPHVSNRTLLLAPAALVLAAVFVGPLVYGVGLSLEGAGSGGALYVKVLTDPFYLKVLTTTFVLGLGVTCLCALLGYPCAYYIARSGSRWANTVVMIVLSPLLVSIVMRSFGWVALLGRQGLVNTVLQAVGMHSVPRLLGEWPGVVIALVHELLPYMILSIATVLRGVPIDVEEAAQTLGASRWRTFLRVTFPLSLDGVGTGAILVFMLAIGGFVTVLLVGGDNTMILPLLVYQQVNLTHNYALAATLGNILLIVALLVLYLQSRFLRTRGL